MSTRFENNGHGIFLYTDYELPSNLTPGRLYLPTGQPNVLYNLPAEGVHDYQQPIDPAVVSEVKNRSGIGAWGKLISIQVIK